MRNRAVVRCLFLVCLTFATLQSTTAKTPSQNQALAAVSANPAKAKPAIEALRAAGPAGLEMLLATYEQPIKARLAALERGATTPPTAEWKRLTGALDEVAQQKDAFICGLYWYTDFETAKQVAREQKKPILSLRLLGKLNEEYSCANSRFFRTILYSNPEVARYLRENYILHWKSVRPVPKVTIDFGDGRKLERTLTGNSIHYVLNAEGQVVDALPGLYGPQAFLRELQSNKATFTNEELLSALQTYDQRRATYHYEIQIKIGQAWGRDLQLAQITKTATIPGPFLAMEITPLNQGPTPTNSQKKENPPTAVEAAPLAITKEKIEAPLLRFTVLPPSDTTNLEKQMSESDWFKISQLHWADAKLDRMSRLLMRYKNPYACEMPKAAPVRLSDAQFEKMLEKFEQNIALDTVQNEYLRRSKIHNWLGSATQPVEVDQLNERVYAELFLTPSSDPWLGLLDPNIFTALPHDGVVKEQKP
ncbi:MAG: thioredoxin family protein [Blastocatellia bacterium]|nr:thioredoxin family protein [Blastocatellia bacterium]